MPLQYFEKTPTSDWKIKDIFEAIQKKYPDKERAYHGLTTKKELEQLTRHSKQLFRARAEELLKKFKLPDPQHNIINQQNSTPSGQLANSITNNAHIVNQ